MSRVRIGIIGTSWFADGKLHRALFHYLAGSGRQKSDAWKFNASRNNGALGDLGSHMIDLARFLIGDIVEVNAKVTA